jgi:hypothetical protein
MKNDSTVQLLSPRRGKKQRQAYFTGCTQIKADNDMMEAVSFLHSDRTGMEETLRAFGDWHRQVHAIDRLGRSITQAVKRKLSALIQLLSVFIL